MKFTDGKFQEVLDTMPLNWIDIKNKDLLQYQNKTDLSYYNFKVTRDEAIFYFGGCDTVHKLLEIFIKSTYIKTIQTLYIGIFNESQGSYDYQKIVKILSKGNFPKLKFFSIGNYDELYNGGMNFLGNLGDITYLLEIMSHLEYLELNGYFELKKRLTFLYLKKLFLLTDSDTRWWYPNLIDQDISQNTLDNFLLSSYPKLLYFEIGVDDDSSFTFPKLFLEAPKMPILEQLTIEGGFKIGEKEKILQSPLSKLKFYMT